MQFMSHEGRINNYYHVKVPVPLEKEEQCNFVSWLEEQQLKFPGRIKFTAIPNSTWTPSWKQKRQNYNTGLRGGFPDMVVVIDNILLLPELKRVKGSVISDEQKEWIAALNKVGNVEARICYGAEEAKQFISSFLYESGR